MVQARDELRQSIEPLFLTRVMEGGLRLIVGQMNKTVHVGALKDIGRYEVNIEENGRIVTILKQEISFITAPHPVITSPPAGHPPQEEAGKESRHTKPNIQQEFLDRAIKENQSLTIFLINGQKLKAQIEAYDNFTLLLREGERQHLFYKHAITTINR